MSVIKLFSTDYGQVRIAPPHCGLSSWFCWVGGHSLISCQVGCFLLFLLKTKIETQIWGELLLLPAPYSSDADR
jgi:hypothetical protein